jgi:phosphatidylglycerol---prolipoprotein diacylglyceryl transferase
MQPLLVSIGPFTIYSYGFFIAFGFLIGLVFAAFEAGRRGLDPRVVSDVGFYIILSAIVGSRLLYVLLNPRYFLNNPLEILMFWKGGLVFLGGALLAALTVSLYFQSRSMSVWPWADCFAPALALGEFFGRMGCLSAGCCYGKVSDQAWAITFTHSASMAPLNTPLHPTQAYLSLAALVTFLALLASRKALQGHGQLFGLFLILYAVFRLAIEFFRGDFRADLGIFSLTQILALLIMAAGVFLLRSRRA